MEIIDHDYGAHIDLLLYEAEQHLEDDGIYFIREGVMGPLVAGVTYASSEGVYCARRFPVDRDGAAELEARVREAASGMGLAVHTGAVAHVNDNVVRVHGASINDLEVVAAGYLEKLVHDDVRGEFKYSLEEDPFMDPFFVGSIKKGDALYIVSGYADVDVTAGFLGELEAAGLTVREGLDQETRDTLEALKEF